MSRVIEYARSGDVHIAYQVVGSENGRFDVVFVPGHISHLELDWDFHWAPVVKRMATLARVILFDKRGTGLSDRVNDSDLPGLEQRMDDVRAVMDAAGSRKAAIIGVSEGGSMGMLFAATYPERTSALVLYGSFARLAWASDFDWGIRPDQQKAVLERFEAAWGKGAGLPFFCPTMAGNEAYEEQYARLERMAVSPSGASALLRMDFETDVRSVLPAVSVPTLVLHRIGDRVVSVQHARAIARQIPGARLAELPGDDHDPANAAQADEIADEIEEFLTGVKPMPAPDRILATILFTDIVDSTVLLTRLGDRAWRELLERHHRLVRRELVRFHGREIDVAGDGFFAAFDGPTRAVRCALAIRDALSKVGLQVRAGLHTGECEKSGERLTGIAVHLAARVAASAAPDEVRVSSTVKDLVAGAGLAFTDCGRVVLKGISGDWQLWSAA